MSGFLFCPYNENQWGPIDVVLGPNDFYCVYKNSIDVLQNIHFLCVPKKKDNHTGLRKHEDE